MAQKKHLTFDEAVRLACQSLQGSADGNKGKPRFVYPALGRSGYAIGRHIPRRRTCFVYVVYPNGIVRTRPVKCEANQ